MNIESFEKNYPLILIAIGFFLVFFPFDLIGDVTKQLTVVGLKIQLSKVSYVYPNKLNSYISHCKIYHNDMQRNLPQVQGDKGKKDRLLVQTRCKAMHHMRHLHKVGRYVVSLLRVHAKKQAQGQPVQAEAP